MPLPPIAARPPLPLASSETKPPIEIVPADAEITANVPVPVAPVALVADASPPVAKLSTSTRPVSEMLLPVAIDWITARPAMALPPEPLAAASPPKDEALTSVRPPTLMLPPFARIVASCVVADPAAPPIPPLVLPPKVSA